ncbi:MAG: IS200/IS605 family transposase [bacterium]
MLYHYNFRTYLRKPTLEDKEIRLFLKEIFLEISKEKGFDIIECEILSEHVHILIEHSYTLSTSQVMKFLKGISARRLFQQYPTNRFEHKKLWGRSFFAKKITNEEKDNVIDYIRNQRNEEGIDKRF